MLLPRFLARLIGLLILALCASCGRRSPNDPIASTSLQIPAGPSFDIQDPEKFLNDLKLSPFWKVERDRNGTFVAMARMINSLDSPYQGPEGEFLFELMAKENPQLPTNSAIVNEYLAGSDLDGDRSKTNLNTFVSMSIKVLFRKPDVWASVASRGSKTLLRIYGEEHQSRGNDVSELALSISTRALVYLVVHEQGGDRTRSCTLRELASASRELQRLENLPSRYRVAEVYDSFYTMLFKKAPREDHELGRFPGSQDRDTFYGYFRAKEGVSYEGINIKISHPVYCAGECTRDYERKRKADYLGRPYESGDVLFFLIEDNAVYLPYEYDKQFGTFSGTNSFAGTLEVLNGQGTVLLQTVQQFKSWER